MFGDLEEHIAINKETHQQLMHKFIEFLLAKLYHKCVNMPRNAEEHGTHRHELNVSGLAGAGFFTDATNVVMWHCSHRLKQVTTGFKQSHPARSYNVFCNHHHQILCSTWGHPNRWNDKNVCSLDKFLSGIHVGKMLQDVGFTLCLWKDGVWHSSVEKIKHRAGWGLSNNGCHRPLGMHASTCQSKCLHCWSRTEQLDRVVSKRCRVHFWNLEGSILHVDDWYQTWRDCSHSSIWISIILLSLLGRVANMQLNVAHKHGWGWSDCWRCCHSTLVVYEHVQTNVWEQ